MKIALFTTNRTTIPPEPDIVAATASLTGVLADKLVEKGHDVFLYAPQGSQTQAQLIDLGLPPTHLDFSLQKEEWVKNLSFGMKSHYLAEVFKNAKEYDVIHLQTEPIYLGMALAKLSSTPTLFTVHNTFNPAEAMLLEVYKDLPIATISKYQQSVLPFLNYAGVVYDGVEIEKYKFFEKPSGDYMYFMGRLVHAKGVSEAIKSAQTLQKPLKIAGAGNQEVMNKLVNPYLTESIVSLGIIPRYDVAWFENLGNARLTLFPILWEEPFGLVMIESMATGTPVVAYARGSAPEVIVDGETGFLINPSDEDTRGDFIIKKTGFDGLCEAIQRIYAMPQQEYMRMRENARKRVEENFTADRMVESYIDIYQKLTS